MTNHKRFLGDSLFAQTLTAVLDIITAEVRAQNAAGKAELEKARERARLTRLAAGGAQ